MRYPIEPYHGARQQPRPLPRGGLARVVIGAGIAAAGMALAITGAGIFAVLLALLVPAMAIASVLNSGRPIWFERTTHTRIHIGGEDKP